MAAVVHQAKMQVKYAELRGIFAKGDAQGVCP
jgi:hypothetical protein